jgi:phosphatidylethanolamine-binding protein (PEBP) family uncharacterized protein
MKPIKNSRQLSLAVAAFCIIALLSEAASAAITPNQSVNNPGGSGGAPEKYTMEQTLSDRGQEATIAFDALAFVTGDACSDTFLPPGKVADYAGFQYLRDNDATQMGHNTDFVTRISDNVLYTLTEDQLKQFSALSEYEAPLNTQYGYMRYPLTKAFRASLEGNIPSGSTGLDKAAVMAYSAQLYDVDASISIARAKTYASVIRSMNESQRAYLDRMKSTGMANMPVVDSLAAQKNGGQGNSVALRTYASEMFAWYAGSVEADVYFCPERQATYFGSFYMKDAPAMGNAGYSISTTLTGDSGEAFLNLVTTGQRSQITGLVDLQRNDLTEIVAKRTAIATELRKALAGEIIDEASVRALSARYGELDGEISYYYASHFADVSKTLTSDQKTKAVALRNLPGYACQGGYLYSQTIDYPQDVPSDFLFGVGSYDSSRMAAWLAAQRTTALQAGGPGSGNAGKGPGNVTVPGNGRQQGNTTQSGQGNGHQGGAGNQQGAGQGQQNLIPVEDVIARLEQKGYDVSGVKVAVQNGDHEAMKAWMGQFKKNNPGVAESIEGTGTGTPQDRNNRKDSENLENLSPPLNQQGNEPISSSFSFWLAHLWNSIWGNNPAPMQNQPNAQNIRPVSSRNQTWEGPSSSAQTFTLTSEAGTDGGTMPGEYSCDGSGSSPALSWSGAPAGTEEYVLMMTTIPVDGSTRWNWVLYHIPGTATGIARNGSSIGVLGTGSHGTVIMYDPPCSQGPGAKIYTFTLYALSASPELPANPGEVTGPVLTSAISNITLGRASLNLSHARAGQS